MLESHQEPAPCEHEWMWGGCGKCGAPTPEPVSEEHNNLTGVEHNNLKTVADSASEEREPPVSKSQQKRLKVQRGE